MMNSGAVGSGKIKIDNNTFLKQLRQDYPILNTKFDMGWDPLNYLVCVLFKFIQLTLTKQV
ncbi:hypothetical protein DIS10_08035 [Leuconostoc mesenteroides]|nr:hypothetical protein DIS10_08035 [Leuconostoc mesenteroides]